MTTTNENDKRFAAAIGTTPDVVGPVVAEIRGVPDALKPDAVGEPIPPLRFGAEIVRVGCGWWNVQTRTHWLSLIFDEWIERSVDLDRLGSFDTRAAALAALNAAPPPPGWVEPKAAPAVFVGNSLTNRPETAGERDARERLQLFSALDALGDLQRRIGEAVFELALELKHAGGGVAPYVTRRIETDAARVVAALRKLEREP